MGLEMRWRQKQTRKDSSRSLQLPQQSLFRRLLTFIACFTFGEVQPALCDVTEGPRFVAAPKAMAFSLLLCFCPLPNTLKVQTKEGS